MPDSGNQRGKVVGTDYLCLIAAIKRSRRPLKRLTMAIYRRGRGGEGRGGKGRGGKESNLAQ
jgi:hypothetical protein